MENKQSIFAPFIKQLEKIDKKINDKFNNKSLLQPQDDFILDDEFDDQYYQEQIRFENQQSHLEDKNSQIIEHYDLILRTSTMYRPPVSGSNPPQLLPQTGHLYMFSNRLQFEVKVLNSFSLKKKSKINGPVRIGFDQILSCHVEKKTLYTALLISIKSENPFISEVHVFQKMKDGDDFNLIVQAIGNWQEGQNDSQIKQVLEERKVEENVQEEWMDLKNEESQIIQNQNEQIVQELQEDDFQSQIKMASAESVKQVLDKIQNQSEWPIQLCNDFLLIQFEQQQQFCPSQALSKLLESLYLKKVKNPKFYSDEPLSNLQKNSLEKRFGPEMINFSQFSQIIYKQKDKNVKLIDLLNNGQNRPFEFFDLTEAFDNNVNFDQQGQMFDQNAFNRKEFLGLLEQKINTLQPISQKNPFELGLQPGQKNTVVLYRKQTTSIDFHKAIFQVFKKLTYTEHIFYFLINNLKDCKCLLQYQVIQTHKPIPFCDNFQGQLLLEIKCFNNGKMLVNAQARLQELDAGKLRVQDVPKFIKDQVREQFKGQTVAQFRDIALTGMKSWVDECDQEVKFQKISQQNNQIIPNLFNQAQNKKINDQKKIEDFSKNLGEFIKLEILKHKEKLNDKNLEALENQMKIEMTQILNKKLQN